MLAKNVNDNARILDERAVREFFASKLAPTVHCTCLNTSGIVFWSAKMTSGLSIRYNSRLFFSGQSACSLFEC